MQQTSLSLTSYSALLISFNLNSPYSKFHLLKITSWSTVFFFFSLPAWAGGAISYELFGARNPFEGGELDSRTYQDEHLPLLCRAQPMVRKVVSWLLKRDPSERVTADMAAIMLAVVLWAPAEWLQSNSHVSVTDVNRWLFDLSYRILTCTGTCTTENKIQCQFLSSATAADVVDALELLREETI
ncbi:PREDICTED: serine/threonine-protein kinase PINK1, mitochondrial-like [Acropora digitifera]|uniref:serine/threonine-protein kinase PINK1, mitochondrial-like n=1 Tax=Acropora digitifera TaxID=70779 RepID=UPI00077A5B8B|nr:PREDICTED: serine/threonine-protein kinase PINK1, mitochondrial-like [Acropora digitifera]